MKSIRFHEFGKPDVLTLEEVPDPKPGMGQALVRLQAAGVNPTDVASRRGGGAGALKLPASLGRDGAGVVEAVGSGVKKVKSGDKVIVRNGSACYSELVTANEEDLYPVPNGVGPLDAASIGVTYSTAWDAVVNKANVQRGQFVLVQGASGGVGIAAVQIAKALGATVIGAASTDEKRKWVLGHGADHAVDYTAEGWPAKVKELTGGKGVNAVIDGVGGKQFAEVWDALATGANVCIFGASGGRDVTLNVTSIYRTRAHVHGCAGVGCSREDFLKMLDLFGQGKLKPTVEGTLPLAQAADAHRAIEERQVIGKIVLKVS